MNKRVDKNMGWRTVVKRQENYHFFRVCLMLGFMNLSAIAFCEAGLTYWPHSLKFP